MRRRFLVVGLAGLAAALGAVLFFAQPGDSQEPNKLAAAPAKAQLDPPPTSLRPATPLPIRNVVLFSSGVGYFQREGEVEGAARVDLTFPVEDINDLLKSLVLQDLGGGQISTISYDSHDPIAKTLRSFALDLTQHPTFGQLLTQARGEKIEVVMNAMPSMPGQMSGTIVGVEKQKLAVGKETVETEMLNILCADGLRSLPVNQVQRIRFLNPVLERELRMALDELARAHDTQKKAVSLNFSGEGKRPVRVGYVVENPIWKTSYRLVLGKNDKVFLQGWAVVENTSDDDWSDVRLSLVSGRPISFQMNLYEPLYVPRPMVEPELFASLRPVAYSGGMGGDGRPMGGPVPTAATPPPPKAPAAGLADEHLDRASGLRRKALEGQVLAEKAEFKKIAPMNIAQGVASVASASDLGDYFQYVIDQKVSLPRQKSALLPIMNVNVEGKKVSIYNQAVQAKHPLLGLKFKNTSDQHLMQGPLTVFDNESYAGDARIMDLQPNEERLLSYAVDLGTEVEAVNPHGTETLTTVKVIKGIIHTTNRVREAKTYNVKNRSGQDRLVLVEHPYRQQFTLMTKDKLDEKARDVYRFKLDVAAGKEAKLEVVEELDRQDQVILSSADDQTVRFFINHKVSDAKVNAALERMIEMKVAMAQTQRDLAEVQRQLKVLSDDQTRLRANLREFPQTSEIYKKYLEKFTKQEGEIEALQAQEKQLRQAEESKRKELEGYLLGLDTTK